MSRKAFYLLELYDTIPVSESAEWLGYIVKNYKNPREHYLPEKPWLTEEQYQRDLGFNDVVHIMKQSKSDKVKADMATMFGLDLRAESEGQNKIKSPKVERVRLLNDQIVLNNAMEKRPIKQGLSDWKFGRGQHLWFIVGVLLADETNYSAYSTSNTSAGVTADPGSIAAAAAGDPSGGLGVMQSRAELAHSVGATDRTIASLIGKRIFAIEYRKFSKGIVWGKDELGSGPRGPRSFGPGDFERESESSSNAQQPIYPLDPENFADLDETEDDERVFVLE